MATDTTLLKQQVYDRLNITWSDVGTDRYITTIINSAISTLTTKLAIIDNTFDFSTTSQENNLFLAYCLYVYNHEESNFDDNYHNEILQIRQKNLTNQYESELNNDNT